MLGKEGLPKVSHKETKMVFTITSRFFKNAGIVVVIAMFGIVMFAQGQHFVARQFCDSLNFSTGFVTLSGVTCAAYVEFPYGKKLQPTE